MPQRLSVVLPIILTCFGAPAQCGEESSVSAVSAAVQYWDIVSNKKQSRQSFEASQIQRMEQGRLEAIKVAIERSDWDRSTLEYTLDSIEANLAELVDKFGTEPEVVKRLNQEIGCIRNVLSIKGRPSDDCRFPEAGIAQASWPEDGTVEAAPAEASDVTAALVSTDLNGARYSYSVAIYGQSVDWDFGHLFALLSERAPLLLQPLPIVRDYVVEKCLNGGFSPPIVFASAHKANAAFLEFLKATSDPWRFHGGLTRFTLVSHGLPEQLARTGLELDLPEALEDFTVEEAETLITRDFAIRYGMAALDDALALAALRNLERLLGPTVFLALVADILDKGVQGVRPADVGRALSGLGRSGQDLWSVVYNQASRYRSCHDASQVFAAYDLVYRAGHYRAANATLRNLETHMGVPSVPGLSMNPVSLHLLVSSEPSCQKFGPVELTAGEQEAGLCLKGKVVVNGSEKYRVVAGGAEVRFFVNDAERDIIRAAMREREATPRGGDVMHWRDSTRLGVTAQNFEQSRVLSLADVSSLTDVLPCLINLSISNRSSRLESAKSHVNNYREHFYPLEKSVEPTSLSYVFVIDAFAKMTKVESVRQEIEGLAREISKELASMRALLEQQRISPVGNSAVVGISQFDNSEMVQRICTLVIQQMRKVEQLVVGMHGDLIKSLLVGRGINGLELGVGLLNPAGIYEEDDFSKSVINFPLGELSDGVLKWDDLIRYLNDAPLRIDLLRESAQPDFRSLAPIIVNLSLAREFVGSVTAQQRDHDEKLINDLRGSIEYLNDDALLVVAAGQPPLTVDAEASSANSGRKLEFARTAQANNNDCAVFPACLSGVKNVITVGAVGPSAGTHGLKYPIVTLWSNFGTAVTLGAPGEEILSNDQGFVLGENDFTLQYMKVASLRDGTSFATVFVSAIAAQMAALYPELRASQIKKRLIATARTYWTPTGVEEFFTGNNRNAHKRLVDGYLYAGVINPKVALLDPAKYHVTFRSRPEGERLKEFDLIRLRPSVRVTPSLTVFHSTSSMARPKAKCRWNDLFRIHVKRLTEKNGNGNPIFSGALACKDYSNDDQIQLVSGPFGTENNQQNRCLLDDTCLEGLIEKDWIPLKFEEIEDIYFPVAGR